VDVFDNIDEDAVVLLLLEDEPGVDELLEATLEDSVVLLGVADVVPSEDWAIWLGAEVV
jgi:hypothetical protein